MFSRFSTLFPGRARRAISDAAIQELLTPAILGLSADGALSPQDQLVLAYLVVQLPGSPIATQATARRHIARTTAMLVDPAERTRITQAAAARPRYQRALAFELAADALDSAGVEVATRVETLAALADQIGLETVDVTRRLFPSRAA